MAEPTPASAAVGRSHATSAAPASGDTALDHRNQVVLVGRLTAEPSLRELPSGDHLVTWRVSVTRPVTEQRPKQRVDAIVCASFAAPVQEAVRGWRIGDLVQVEGALRRRFWRSPNGPVSLYEVEVRRAARLGRAAVPPSGVSPRAESAASVASAAGPPARPDHGSRG